MALNPVNIGSAPNDGSGDALRLAFGKLNEDIRNAAADINESKTIIAAERVDRIVVEAQTGTYSLENVGGTGNDITASMPSILTARGISAANIRGIRFVAVANNDGPVSINIDGAGAVDLRGPTGSVLAANRIRIGRIYTAAKVGSRWHLVSGEVTAGDLASERNATIANFGASGWLRLVNVGGTPDAITAEVAGGGADLGANTNGNYVMIRPTATNTTSAPTLQIADGQVRTLYSETNGPLGVGRLVPETWNVILLASNSNAQLQGIFVKPNELPAIRETLTSTTALANSLNNTVTAIAAKSVLEYALQTGNALPARPNAPVVHWLCWTDPSAVMGPADMWFQLPSPTVPDMPAEASWRWRNSRTGTSGILQILSVPAASPPITAVQYRLDGGAWVSVPPVAGEITVPGLTLAQSYAMGIRYANFVGPGVPTAARSITISGASFSDNFNRVDQNLSDDARWLDVAIGNANRRATIFGNAVRPPANNETYVVQVQEYFAPDQFVEARILGGGVNTSAGRGAMLYVRMPTGVNSGYRLRVMGNAWVLSRIVNGVTSTLASGTHANVYPVQARLVAQGSVITAYLGGVIVATVTDADPAAFTGGTVGLGMNVAGSDGVGSVMIDNFTAGNV